MRRKVTFSNFLLYLLIFYDVPGARHVINDESRCENQKVSIVQYAPKYKSQESA